jgi:leader peptidase (prepilin peptidase) / N-methyltransferase
MLPTWFFLTALALFGLAFGSFANVVIWRFPRGESLSSPPSRCPACETPILWYDNVPVASWILLRGRCRACGTRISARYPTVELLSGALWVVAGVRFGQAWQTAFAIAFFYLLMILSFIDWDTMRLPDPLVGLTALIGVVGAIAAAIAGVALVPLTPVAGVPLAPIVTALIGALLGVGVSLAIALLYSLIRKVDGFGGGDVKLLGAMGLFLGPYVLLAFFAGSVLGAVYGLIATAASRLGLQTKFPFGPFLAVGAVLTALWGPSLWHLYTGLLA